MSLKMSTLMGLAALAVSSTAFCDQSMSISPGQTLQITGNCPGTVTLTQNSSTDDLSLQISGEKCSEIEQSGVKSSLIGAEYDFMTSPSLTVSDGELITISGKKATSEKTVLTVNAPSKAHELVPVVDTTDRAAIADCTNQGSTTYPQLGKGKIVGRSSFVQGLQGQIVVPCIRDGVAVPAIGTSKKKAKEACEALDSNYIDLSEGTVANQDHFLVIPADMNSANVEICNRPVKKGAQVPQQPQTPPYQPYNPYQPQQPQSNGYACTVTKNYTYLFGTESFSITLGSTSSISMIDAFNQLQATCEQKVENQTPADFNPPTEMCSALTIETSSCKAL